MVKGRQLQWEIKVKTKMNILLKSLFMINIHIISISLFNEYTVESFEFCKENEICAFFI